ncbi:MAG: ABC transporter ATP-binding protein [Gammaproteobacteria bacterium]|nr:ABC transporter ATP-binding protein [Gammaproteobacteria bacterium]
MLEVSSLSRSYGDFMAVDTVGFTIQQGEIVGLLGHNGAGKTTIMKMLSGYLEPNQGTVQIDGVNLADNLKQIQQQVGYLPENLPIYQEMIVADYLDYVAELKGLDTQEKHTEIKRVVEATEIESKLLSPINTLSRGFKQRVGVAQAILGKPKLLILDEPTNGLDPTQTEHMRQLIRDIAEHATVILSTHIMQEVDAVCDRVLILSSGKLVVDAHLHDLRHTNQIRISTSMNKQSIDDKLSEIDAIQSITELDRIEQKGEQADQQPDIHHYRLELHPGHQVQALSAKVSRTLIESGAELYQIQNEQRDLETLFREVSTLDGNRNSIIASREGLNHAA